MGKSNERVPRGRSGFYDACIRACPHGDFGESSVRTLGGGLVMMQYWLCYSIGGRWPSIGRTRNCEVIGMEVDCS